jgi:mRNA-degrading endonuclease RelE of RelBE toxin-antitoxin system
MVHIQPFDLIYDAEVSGHLRAIDRRHHSLIRSTIAEQLTHEPTTETENRKPLKRPVAFGATWELRFGPGNCFRVYYRVYAELREVWILAVGVKERSKVYIGGEEYEL